MMRQGAITASRSGATPLPEDPDPEAAPTIIDMKPKKREGISGGGPRWVRLPL